VELLPSEVVVSCRLSIRCREMQCCQNLLVEQSVQYLCRTSTPDLPGLRPQRHAIHFEVYIFVA
jgi:hypothetical protein